MLSIQHPEYFFALAAVPLLLVLYFFVVSWKKKTSLKIGDKDLVRSILGNYSAARFRLKFFLIILSVCLLVLALVNPRLPGNTEKVSRNGIDLMVALDVSRSMLAQDVKPSRLERSKQFLGKLIDQLGNDRVGIVIFAGRAYLQMPLTTDHSAARMYLSTASPEMVPTQGTVIADALQLCASSFQAGEKKYKSVLLISDGEDHDEDAIKIAGQLADEGILINTIGIGSVGGTTFIDETTHELKKDNNGNIVVTKMNEEELKDIATKGKGIYQYFTNSDEMTSRITSQLNGMSQHTITEDSAVNYFSLFPYFLIPALILLIFDLFLSERKGPGQSWPGSTSAPGKMAIIMFLMIGMPGLVSAQSVNKLIKKGNEAYAVKDYPTAAIEYKKALEKTPGDAVAHYNLGNALYRGSKTGEAEEAYDQVTTSSAPADERAKAFYNKGVLLQNGKNLPECIIAYKNALKLNPDDEDARQNLQKALFKQKQQQKDRQQQQPKEPKKNNKDPEKQQPKDPDKKKDRPAAQNSKMSRQDAEEKLKALLQQEKNLQEKLKRINEAGVSRPEKDW